MILKLFRPEQEFTVDWYTVENVLFNVTQVEHTFFLFHFSLMLYYIGTLVDECAFVYYYRYHDLGYLRNNHLHVYDVLCIILRYTTSRCLLFQFIQIIEINAATLFLEVHITIYLQTGSLK